MSEAIEQRSLLRDLLARVATLEETVAFLELWCEEQQDALDLVGAPTWPSDDGLPRPRLHAVDVRDGDWLPGGEQVVELHEHAPGPGIEPAV